MEVIITSNYEEICEKATRIIHQAWKRKNNLVLGLATGKTPLGVYKKIIELYEKGEMDFSQVVAFTLDEYLGLEEDHPQSFAYYMEKNFYQHTNIKEENIFRLEGKPENIKIHCQEYEEKIKNLGGIDIQILGIGRNGHIGFNEPSSSLASRTRVKTLTQETIKDNARYFKNGEDVPRFCITMGIGTVMDAKMIILLASGKNKSEAILKSIEGPVTATIPASVLQLHPEVKIIIDEEASSLMIGREYYKWVYQNKVRAKDFIK